MLVLIRRTQNNAPASNEEVSDIATSLKNPRFNSHGVLSPISLIDPRFRHVPDLSSYDSDLFLRICEKNRTLPSKVDTLVLRETIKSPEPFKKRRMSLLRSHKNRRREEFSEKGDILWTDFAAAYMKLLRRIPALCPYEEITTQELPGQMKALLMGMDRKKSD